MSSNAFRRAAFRAGLMSGVAAVAAGCSQGGSSSATVDRPAFSESEYGVRSSPRVSTYQGSLPKGGGRYKLGRPYNVAGRWYVPHEDAAYDRQGVASWYGDDFHGRRTSNGELFDRYALSAAHPTLPLPSYVYVTNLQNGRTVMVRVNDRGPYVGGRIIDLSHAAASALGYVGQGRARVRVQYAGRAPLNGDDRRERQFLAQGGRAPAPYAQSVVRRPEVPVAYNSGASPSSGGWSPTAYRSALAGK